MSPHPFISTRLRKPHTCLWMCKNSRAKCRRSHQKGSLLPTGWTGGKEIRLVFLECDRQRGDLSYPPLSLTANGPHLCSAFLVCWPLKVLDATITLPFTPHCPTLMARAATHQRKLPTHTHIRTLRSNSGTHQDSNPDLPISWRPAVPAGSPLVVF